MGSNESLISQQREVFSSSTICRSSDPPFLSRCRDFRGPRKLFRAPIPWGTERQFTGPACRLFSPLSAHADPNDRVCRLGRPSAQSACRSQPTERKRYAFSYESIFPRGKISVASRLIISSSLQGERLPTGGSGNDRF